MYRYGEHFHFSSIKKKQEMEVRIKKLKMIIKDKKGFLRILEAFIAILLIISVLLVLYTSTVSKPKKSEEIYRFQETILNEIAANSVLRRAVLQEPPDTDLIRTYIASRIAPGFAFEIKICTVNEICELDVYKEEMFSTSRIISSDLQEYNPKQVKIFMWRD